MERREKTDRKGKEIKERGGGGEKGLERRVERNEEERKGK